MKSKDRIKRLKIELIVQRHPTLKRIAKYYAEKFRLDETNIYNKFIDFLVAETSMVVGNSLKGVSCFVFDEKTSNFVNKTIFLGIT